MTLSDNRRAMEDSLRALARTLPPHDRAPSRDHTPPDRITLHLGRCRYTLNRTRDAVHNLAVGIGRLPPAACADRLQYQGFALPDATLQERFDF